MNMDDVGFDGLATWKNKCVTILNVRASNNIGGRQRPSCMPVSDGEMSLCVGFFPDGR
jgi:hypothetical protein